MNDYLTTTMDMERRSRVISTLRFPLIVLVVYMHSTGFPALHDARVAIDAPVGWNVYNLLRLALGYVLGEGAVPAFFLISGYLFFRKGRAFTRADYVAKLRRRVHTLLIPYVLWNTLYLLLLLVPRLWAAARSGGVGECLRSFCGEHDFFSIFWSGRGGYPINVPLWFVRDLMVMAVASPLVYGLARGLRGAFPVVLAALWLSRGYADLGVMQTAAFCFFSMGAWLAIAGRSIIGMPRWWRGVVVVAAAALFALDLWQVAAKAHWAVANSLFILAWVAAIFCLGAWVAERRVGERLRRWGGAVFFIYCTHDLTIVSFYDTVMAQWLRPWSPWAYVATFVLAPVVKVGLCLVYRAVAKRLMPRVLQWLEGGRRGDYSK